MKKLIVVLSLSCVIISCGSNDNNTPKEERKEEAKEVAKETKPKSADYQKGLELVAKSDCFTCHKVKETATGPAYEAVAARYQATPEVIDTLANKVISGGSGKWGTVPMLPHPQLSKEDATVMVKYILSLKQ